MSAAALLLILLLFVIIVAVVVVVALMLTRRQEQQRTDRARGLRQEATAGAAAIPEAQVRAREAEVEAERARLEAQRAEETAAQAQQGLSAEEATYEDRVREADRLDPSVDQQADDYAPETTEIDPGRTSTEPTQDDQGGSHRA